MVLPSQDVEVWQKRLCDKAKRYKAVGGGSSRTESSYNGIRATSGDNEIVVIHDGVRPFVTTESDKIGCGCCTSVWSSHLGHEV